MQRRQQQIQFSGGGGVQLISDFSIYTASECPFIDLAAGENLLLRDIGVSIAGPKLPPPMRGPSSKVEPNYALLTAAERLYLAPSPSPQQPYFTARGTVAGKLYGLPLDGIFGGAGSDNGGEFHVLILVDGVGHTANLTRGLHFYQASTEHLVNDKQVFITGSTNVHFHAWKYESSLGAEPNTPNSGSLCVIVNSSDVSSFGSSGNYKLFNASWPMVRVVKSSNITLMGMVRKSAFNEPKQGMNWLQNDDGNGTCIDGYHALLFYQS